jgi:hypothetical protein
MGLQQKLSHLASYDFKKMSGQRLNWLIAFVEKDNRSSKARSVANFSKKSPILQFIDNI